MRRWAISLAVATAAITLASTPASARLAFNTFEPTADLAAHGRIAYVTPLIDCTEGEQVKIRVELTQGDVVGYGTTHGECTGDLTEYPVRVVAHGPEGFEPGTAQVCADAVNTYRGQVQDTRQWCRDGGITLV